MRKLDEIPLSLVPAFYQHAYDRILYLRAGDETPARMLKAIGLYDAITYMLAENDQLSLTMIAKRIGMTYAGLLKTARYLERVGLLEINKLMVASPFILHSKKAIRRYRDLRKQGVTCSFDDVCVRPISDVPVIWYLAHCKVLKARGPNDTAAKALKCLGLLKVIARMRSFDLIVTRAMLASWLDMTPHTLTAHIQYLEKHDLIAVRERRSRCSNAREYQIEVPDPVLEHTFNSLRQLERVLVRLGWQEGLELRDRASALRRRVLEERNEPFVPRAVIFSRGFAARRSQWEPI